MRRGTDGARALISSLSSRGQGCSGAQAWVDSCKDQLSDVASSCVGQRSEQMSLTIGKLRAEHWRAVAPYKGAGTGTCASASYSSSISCRASHQAPHTGTQNQLQPGTRSYAPQGAWRQSTGSSAVLSTAPPAQQAQHRSYAQPALQQPEYRTSFSYRQDLPQAASTPRQPLQPQTQPQPPPQARREHFVKGTVHKVVHNSDWKVVKASLPWPPSYPSQLASSNTFAACILRVLRLHCKLAKARHRLQSPGFFVHSQVQPVEQSAQAPSCSTAQADRPCRAAPEGPLLQIKCTDSFGKPSSTPGPPPGEADLDPLDRHKAKQARASAAANRIETVTGNLPPMRVGQAFLFSGDWVCDQKFGVQLIARTPPPGAQAGGGPCGLHSRRSVPARSFVYGCIGMHCRCQ